MDPEAHFLKPEWERIHLNIPRTWHRFIRSLARKMGNAPEALIYRQCVMAGAPLLADHWEKMTASVKGTVAPPLPPAAPARPPGKSGAHERKRTHPVRSRNRPRRQG